MSHTPHDLGADFPGAVDAIHRRKMTDRHFAALIEEYAQINLAVHRAATRLDSVSDDHERDLRVARLRLKDQISALLRDG